MPGIKDKQGHEWFVDQTEHPFLTGWKCANCEAGTFTQDGCIPADEPKLDEPCAGAPPPVWKLAFRALRGRCLSCGAPRAPLKGATQCADCINKELDSR